MKKTLSRYCKNSVDAKDIIQSTYLKIFENIHLYNSSLGDFEAWSNRILINEYFQLLKKKKRNFYFEETSLEELETIQFNWSHFKIEEVKKVINKLSEKHAVLLNLHFFDELSYSELSKLLNIRESSVRSNICRARKAFEKEWCQFNK
ncbi:MAG: sigma-70 family RNA polymerase sigma factor [Saprospiraceae bacterium]|nr:sigma-70 family RNA polymerase sigma factor [Saprospiraceae bacterium]